LSLWLVLIPLAVVGQDKAAQSSTAPTAQQPAAEQPATPTNFTSAKGFVLEDGTPVRIRINRSISSADAHTGDTVDFDVIDDITVNGTLVIARGSLAFATVTEAQAKRRMARGGKLDINIDYVKLVNSDRAPLRAVKDMNGGGHTGAMVGGMVATSIVFFPAAPFFLFMHGKDISIPKGTEVTAYVSGDIKMDLAKFPACFCAAVSGERYRWRGGSIHISEAADGIESLRRRHRTRWQLRRQHALRCASARR
jgi:hypothetical protein